MQPPTKRQLTEWARLTQKKYRRELGRFLIEGDVCVREALAAHVEIEVLLALHSEAERWADEAARASVDLYSINSETFERFARVESSQGIVAVARTFEHARRRSDLFIACEQVSDPGNCGALIRVADFFGAAELLLGPDSAEIWNSKVVRGSMGSLFKQPVRVDVDMSELIQKWPGSSVATVAHDGEPLAQAGGLQAPVLLVLGHETRGLSDSLAELCTHRLTLTPQGDAESLNLVTAAAVFAYALRVKSR